MPKGAADITHLAGWNIGIPADAKNPDGGWQFLEFVLGKTNAVNYLKAGAAAIGRKSISTDAGTCSRCIPICRCSTFPATSRIERYPQIRVWPEFEKAVLDALPGMLTGEVPIQAGPRRAEREAEANPRRREGPVILPPQAGRAGAARSAESSEAP